MKRFTTHGMGSDQGRIGGLVGSAILAQARGLTLAEVGVPKPRPYVQPVAFAALAGGEVREHYKPKRRLPLHDWHEASGALFVPTGLWLRPLVYARTGGWDAVLAQARAVRTGVGITVVSSLGKIDIQGADAARFLDFIYANTFSTLPVGRARYGIMLREDGMMFDDGTTARLAAEHFLVTTTTANAIAVLEHLEFQLQANCAHLQVSITDVADQWAQFAIAGPHARAVLAAALPAADLSNEAVPFMAAVPGRHRRRCRSDSFASPSPGSSRTSSPYRRDTHSVRGARCCRRASTSASDRTGSTRSTRCASRRDTSRARSLTAIPAPRTLASNGS